MKKLSNNQYVDYPIKEISGTNISIAVNTYTVGMFLSSHDVSNLTVTLYTTINNHEMLIN
jgi:hypothetical protein